jgi:asparagine synthetase B (glutamine-hydrolysing)
MCSFTITDKDTNIYKDTNFYSQKRGPDSTTQQQIDGVQFLHNLLHITGDVNHQPLTDDDIVCVMNGEIYNYNEFGDYKSDADCIIPLYKEYGLEFAKKLDGEFAIVVIDFKRRRINLINDTFATKPLWFTFENSNFGIASYESSLNACGFTEVEKMCGNQAIEYNLDTFTRIRSITLTRWDLNQHKDTYDDWVTAFENSIRKRTLNTEQGIFLGLSAGYDSGAITCELTKQDVDFTAYTILSTENKDVINNRHKMIVSGDIIELTQNEYDEFQARLITDCEEFTYTDRFKNYNIKGDKASVGLSVICDRANYNGQKIYFSGQGADEIISDYGFNGNKIYDHSSFGGKFPTDLDGFFPWHSFYDGTQVQYLNKEEYVAGSFGIETRYPFLDKQLVQEFLWLTPELKNKSYKAPLQHYLSKNDFPFEDGKKTGFQADRNLL